MKFRNYIPEYERYEPVYQYKPPSYLQNQTKYQRYLPDYARNIDFTTDINFIVPPFRYFGSKRKLLMYNTGIHKFFNKCDCYVEPFIGAAAAYCFAYNNKIFKRAIINDSDEDLIALYTAYRDTNSAFIECLKDTLTGFPAKANGEIRREFIFKIVQPYFTNLCGQLDRTVLFYILRKNWFNGMHKGRYNNIHNLTSNGPIILKDISNIKNFERALQNTMILCGDYKDIAVPDNSFVYMDPPYFVETMSTRTGYCYNFSNAEQATCIEWCRAISSPSVRVVFSNADCDYIRRFLGESADIHQMSLFHSAARRMATEILAVFKP